MHSGHCSGNTQSGRNQQFSNNLNVHCWVNNWSITGLFSMHSLELYTSSSKCCLKKSGCSKSKHEETSIHIANQYSFSVPPGAIDGGFACSVANIAPSSVPLWSKCGDPTYTAAKPSSVLSRTECRSSNTLLYTTTHWMYPAPLLSAFKNWTRNPVPHTL